MDRWQGAVDARVPFLRRDGPGAETHFQFLGAAFAAAGAGSLSAGSLGGGSGVGVGAETPGAGLAPFGPPPRRCWTVPRRG